MLELLNNASGIIVAVIASFTAFKLYNHKQQQTKKYEVYETIFESLNKLNRYAIQSKGTCNDMLLSGQNNTDTLNEISKNISEARSELVLKRHLIYLYTSPSFTTEFKRFEARIDVLIERWDKMLQYFSEDGYDVIEHIDIVYDDVDAMFQETERLITQTRTIVDHDLNKQ